MVHIAGRTLFHCSVRSLPGLPMGRSVGGDDGPGGGATLGRVAASIDFTIAFEEPDEQGWIVARVLEVPGALSQGRTREEARENALDALGIVLTPDEELAGEAAAADREHLRFTAAA